MVQRRLGGRRTSLAITFFLLVGLVTAVSQRPAQAVSVDGPPVIGQDPPVPQSQNPAGGGAVRIYGEGLLDVSAVTIGGVSLATTDFKVVDSDLIIAQVPPAGPGVLNAANDGFAHITITDPDGTSTTDLDGDGVVDDQKCSSCTGGELGAIFYTDATLTLSTSTNLDAGETSTMTLAGHRPGTQGGWALTELNPLVNFLEDAPPDPDNQPPGPGYGEVLDFLTPDASGGGSRAVTVKSTTSSTPFNNKDQDYDANGDCPVSQTTADYGLDKCILGYSEFGMASLEKLISFGTDAPDINPTPAAPTLNLTLSSAAVGSTVSMSGINWNAAPHFGSDTAMDDPGESAVLISVCDSAGNNCTPAGSPAASVSPTRYFDSGSDPDMQPVTGVYSGATLSGSFTVPSCGAGCTPALVKVQQQRYDIETNAPIAATYVTATASMTTALGATNLAVNDVSVTEGNSGTTTATFAVARSGNVSGVSSVQYATANGTATAGSDYTAVGATALNFAAGETSKLASVTVTGNTVFEPDETFTVNLTNATGATIADAAGTGTIRNDDGPSYVSVNDITVAEGNTGTTAAKFNVSRDGNTSGTSTVNYTTANGTATAGSDYTAVGTTTLSFGPGETTKAVTVNVTGDTVVDSSGKETFTVTLSSPSTGTSISDTSGTATIVDNDATPTLTVDNVVVIEGNSGTTAATFTVKRWGASGGTASVNYSTSNGSATAGSDYTALSTTTLNFAAGDTSKTVTVNVTGDFNSESNETFNLNLASAVGANIADSAAVGTIKSDEGTIAPVAPSISVNDVSVVEGSAGTTAANFTVTRSGDTAGTSSVNYATANGSAFSTTDYTAIPATTMNFAAGETSKTVTVNVTANLVYEESAASETFSLNLSSPVGATISDTSGTATIFNDDPVYISITDVAVLEGNSGTTTAQFIISRAGGVEGTTTLTYATGTGTATAGSDYTAISSTTTTFAGDESSKLVSVTVTGDTINTEGDETFPINLTGITTGHTGSDTQGIGTIANDD